MFYPFLSTTDYSVMHTHLTVFLFTFVYEERQVLEEEEEEEEEEEIQ